jgi:hypothetical protein
MVFTRRKKQPKHNNYTTIDVHYYLIKLEGTTIYI